jgi:glycogen debranching enzyme
MIVQYTITNAGNQKRSLKFEFATKTDLSPVWLAEEIGIKDGADTVVWDEQKKIFTASDKGNTWFAVWGSTNASSAQSVGNPIPVKTKGIGLTASAEYNLSLDKNGSTVLSFIIAGSAKNKEEALTSYQYLAKNCENLLQQKKKHYASVIERAKIKIPDRLLQDVYNWVKVNNEWMIRDVPEIGRGLSAGYPEYPWWFGCDNTYSLQAVMASGDFDLAKRTMRLLKNESMKKNGNGRIIHEVSTNGVVYNPGNTQETAHFIMVAEKLFRWTGDIEFIKEMYPVMKMGIRWLLNDMDQNKNLFPEGYGIMEVYGLNAELIDVAVYTQQALQATARIAGILNEPKEQKDYEKLAAELAVRINKNFWDEAESSYCDFFGTKAQAISAAEGAITQKKRDTDELEENKERIAIYEQLKQKFAAMPDESRCWITNKNWVINTPIEMGIAPEEKAISLLNKIRKENVGEYGPYLSAVEKNAMMTISTGVQAVAEAKYGRMDESIWYVNKIVETFNRVLPGSMSEMMPDYGDFTQAWTAYGIVVPLVEHVFGIQPDAYNKTVVIEPKLPTGWDEVSIESLPVGANVISFSRAKNNNGIEYTLNGKEPDWNVILKLQDLPGAKYSLNGRTIIFNPSGIKMTGKENKLLVIQ